jgi:hypothetical protein
VCSGLGPSGGVVAVGFLGEGFLGEEVFEALADILVPALGAIEAALAGGVVQVEKKEDLADCAANGHGGTYIYGDARGAGEQ